MGTLTPEQTAILLKGLLLLQQQQRAVLKELDQILTIFGSIPPKVP